MSTAKTQLAKPDQKSYLPLRLGKLYAMIRVIGIATADTNRLRVQLLRSKW